MCFVHGLSAQCYATDGYKAYRFFPHNQHLVGKEHTFTVEGKNSQIRHYLARFHRRTKCYSKSLAMARYSLILLLHKLNITILC